MVALITTLTMRVMEGYGCVQNALRSTVVKTEDRTILDLIPANRPKTADAPVELPDGFGEM